MNPSTLLACMVLSVVRSLVALAAALVAAGGSAFAVDASSLPCTGLLPGPARTVTRVIDGETLALDDGTELRLIGADAARD
jgi:endonuclease YncB( thermonuclease family)